MLYMTKNDLNVFQDFRVDELIKTDNSLRCSGHWRTPTNDIPDLVDFGVQLVIRRNTHLSMNTIVVVHTLENKRINIQL